MYCTLNIICTAPKYGEIEINMFYKSIQEENRIYGLSPVFQGGLVKVNKIRVDIKGLFYIKPLILNPVNLFLT